MNRLYFLFVLAAVLGSACSEQSYREQTGVNVSPQGSENIRAFTSYSAKFQKILQSEQGVLRGVDFNDALEDVIIREDTTVLEDSTNFVSFTVALDEQEKELADIRYYIDNSQRINGFRLDVYAADKPAGDSLFSEFSTFFTQRYGSPVSNQTRAISWRGDDQSLIVLKDVGNTPSPGFQVQISRP